MPMEVTSEPQYTIEEVVDLSVMVPSGLCNFTLREGDKYHQSEDGSTLLVLWNKRTIVFNMARVDYFEFADRTIKTPVKKADWRPAPFQAAVEEPTA